MPVIVLFAALLFLNYTVEYFRDTSYNFVYDTNVESVKRFSKELNDLSVLGYTSRVYGDLYTNMIRIYSKTLGEKDAIVTFLVFDGQIIHSSKKNEAYLTHLLEKESNLKTINDAFESRSNGELILDHDGNIEKVYYHRFYSGPDDFCLFMCVEKQAIKDKLHADNVIIPVSIFALLLLFMTEYTIWLKIVCVRNEENENHKEESDQDEDKLY
jgi:hypothetical protein